MKLNKKGGEASVAGCSSTGVGAEIRTIEQGPFSLRRANIPEQPGPPVSQRIKGSEAGLERDSNIQ